MFYIGRDEYKLSTGPHKTQPIRVKIGEEEFVCVSIEMVEEMDPSESRRRIMEGID
jgi:hypothetical protein